MTEEFPAQFVLAIRDLSEQYSQMVDNIRHALKRKPRHKCATMHSIPDDYYELIPSKSAIINNGKSTQRNRLHTVRNVLVISIHKDDDDDVFYRVADVTLASTKKAVNAYDAANINNHAILSNNNDSVRDGRRYHISE
jgi:hypothetical protein